jgi:hypothetical protein
MAPHYGSIHRVPAMAGQLGARRFIAIFKSAHTVPSAPSRHPRPARLSANPDKHLRMSHLSHLDWDDDQSRMRSLSLWQVRKFCYSTTH